MPTLTVRNLPEDTVKALKVAAARRGRSMEAEVRALITREYAPDRAVAPAPKRPRVLLAHGLLLRYRSRSRRP